MERTRSGIAIARVTLTLCLSLALCFSMSIPSLTDYQTTGCLTELFYNIKASLSAKGSVATPLFFLLLWANGKLDQRKAERRLLFPLVSAFIALIWLMGEGFRVDNSLRILYASMGQMVKSIIYFVGITYGMSQLAYFLYGALEQQEEKEPEQVLSGQRTWRSRIVKVYREHTVLISFLAILILWLPHLILAYPANFCWDAYNQLRQFFGLDAYSSHHPVASTLMMGGLIKAGSLVSSNFGLFLYIAVQTIAGAWVLAYSLSLMRELHAPAWLRGLAFGCCAVVPYYTAYIGLFLKDVPYAYATVLFMVELIYLLMQSQDFFRSGRHILLLAISLAGTLLLRNNGQYMIYPTVAAVLLYLFFQAKKKKGSNKVQRHILSRAVAALLIPLLLTQIVLMLLMSHLTVTPGSIREALSLPMQQTARYVKEFGDEVTEEEKAAISTVLDYEHLAERYNPRISDPVKGLFDPDPSVAELKIYLLVWLKQFTKHPFVYVEATVNQNYYLLYPHVANDVAYVNLISDPSEWGPSQQEVAELLAIDDVETIARQKAPTRAWYIMCFHLPVLNLLSHPALYMLLLIWLSVFAFYRKRFVWLLASLPMWLNAAVLVLAPVIQGHPRYAFPNIYSMPVLLAYFLSLRRSEKDHG